MKQLRRIYQLGSTFQSVSVILSDSPHVSQVRLSVCRPVDIAQGGRPEGNVASSWAFPGTPAQAFHRRTNAAQLEIAGATGRRDPRVLAEMRVRHLRRTLGASHEGVF